MVLLSALEFVAFLAQRASATSPQTPFLIHHVAQKQSIEWSSCGVVANHSLECGRLTVPLDYFDYSRGTVSLSVIRMLAEPQKRKGSIYTNMGGPGVGGTGDRFRLMAPDMMWKADGEYDIVSWDLRGLNDTKPRLDCQTPEEWNNLWEGSLWFKGVETNSSLESDFDRRLFYSRVDDMDSRLVKMWEGCKHLEKDLLPYVGTATSARDIASLADAIDGEGSDINYWAGSYGSVLGQYLIKLYAHRLGRVIIEAIVYGTNWSVKPGVELFNRLLEDSDTNYLAFTELCAKAGPEGCALAEQDSSPEFVQNEMDRLLHAAYNPAYLESKLTNSGMIRAIMFLMMQVPDRWQGAAEWLKSELDVLSTLGTSLESQYRTRASNLLQNVTQKRDLKTYIDQGFFTTYWSVVCSDIPDPDGTTTLDVFKTVEKARNISSFFGTIWPDEGAWPCHRWPVRAVERVTDFRAEPKHPILIMSNKYDPVTSLGNAKLALKNNYKKGDAGLVIRDGYGHGTFTMKSSCLVDVIRAYLKNWTLPDEDTEPCPTETDLFPPK